MSGARFKEQWEQFMSDLRQQWVKFRDAHLVQDEKYDEKVTGQFPRLHADTWGYSETGQRMRAVISPEPHGGVPAFTTLSIEDRDTMGIRMDGQDLLPNTQTDTTIGTALVPGGAFLGEAALPLV